MAALFRKPKIPAPTTIMAPPPTPVPTIDEAANRVEFSRKARRRRGHAANIKSSGGQPSVAAREVLG